MNENLSGRTMSYRDEALRRAEMHYWIMRKSYRKSRHRRKWLRELRRVMYSEFGYIPKKIRYKKPCRIY